MSLLVVEPTEVARQGAEMLLRDTSRPDWWLTHDFEVDDVADAVSLAVESCAGVAARLVSRYSADDQSSLDDQDAGWRVLFDDLVLKKMIEDWKGICKLGFD